MTWSQSAGLRPIRFDHAVLGDSLRTGSSSGQRCDLPGSNGLRNRVPVRAEDETKRDARTKGESVVTAMRGLSSW